MTPSETVVLSLPFTGRWLVQNSPASRVPSHGTTLFGSSYAIDFVPVGADGRSAPRTIRSLLGTESPEGFVGFGRSILSPVSGEVVRVHDGEVDHVARRSVGALLGYALTQPSRVRRGAGAVAGNHVAVRCDRGLVLLAHLRAGSVTVRVGDLVVPGDRIGDCGNSGNSTEPHLHLHVSDTLERDARGIPMAFQRSGQQPWMPHDGDIVTV